MAIVGRWHVDEPPEDVAHLRETARRASDDDGAALERQVECAAVTTQLERTELMAPSSRTSKLLADTGQFLPRAAGS